MRFAQNAAQACKKFWKQALWAVKSVTNFRQLSRQSTKCFKAKDTKRLKIERMFAKSFSSCYNCFEYERKF